MTKPASGDCDTEVSPDLEAAADEAIALCGGNARAAVVALIVLNDAMERELALTRVAVSSGFSRGWHKRRSD